MRKIFFFSKFLIIIRKVRNEKRNKGKGEIAVNCQAEKVKRELLGVRARQGWCWLGRTLHALLRIIGKVRYP